MTTHLPGDYTDTTLCGQGIDDPREIVNENPTCPRCIRRAARAAKKEKRDA